jgi:hypothetical protein
MYVDISAGSLVVSVGLVPKRLQDRITVDKLKSVVLPPNTVPRPLLKEFVLDLPS